MAPFGTIYSYMPSPRVMKVRTLLLHSKKKRH